MTVDVSPEGDDLNRRISENLTTLMFRLSWKQKDAAAAIGMNAVTFGRKLKCVYDWTVPEVARLAAATQVEVPELLGDLPDFDLWRARRDSNPKPSVWVSVQVSRPRLTLISGGLSTDAPADAARTA